MSTGRELVRVFEGQKGEEHYAWSEVGVLPERYVRVGTGSSAATALKAYVSASRVVGGGGLPKATLATWYVREVGAGMQSVASKVGGEAYLREQELRDSEVTSVPVLLLMFVGSLSVGTLFLWLTWGWFVTPLVDFELSIAQALGLKLLLAGLKGMRLDRAGGVRWGPYLLSTAFTLAHLLLCWGVYWALS